MKIRSVIITIITAGVATLLYLSYDRGSDSAVAQFKIAEGTQPIAAPVYIADAKGFFKDEGVDVKLISFPTGKLCLDAVIGGNADFATVAETPIMHASFKNQPIKIVATMHRSRQNTICIARKDMGVNSVGDLKGKTIGVPLGTNAEYGISALLEKNGLLPSDVKLINLSPPEMIGPISNRELAAVTAWQPHAGRCEKAVGENGIRLSLEDVYEETYNLVTSTKMAEVQTDTTAKVLKALERGVAFMRENRDESIDIVSKRIGMEKAELERLWPIYNFGLDLRQSLVDTMTAQGKWAVARGHQSGAIPEMKSVISAKALITVDLNAVDEPITK